MRHLYLAIYRWLLKALPRDFRERYGDDALAMTARRLQDTSSSASVRVAARELIDLARIISKEWGRAVMAGWAFDVLTAWRSLRRRPAQAVVVTLLFAVGLGATTAMFSVVDAVLLRPLPYPNGRQLVRLMEHEPRRNLSGTSFPAMADWSRLPSLTRVAGSSSTQLLFHHGADGERVRGASVSPGFFATLGTAAALGHVLHENAPLFDADPKIVLGDSLWRRQFNGDPAVVGRVLVLEERQFTVVGVMPPGFSFPAGTEFWTSFPLDMRRIGEARTLRFLDVIGELAPTATVEDLTRDLASWGGSTASLLQDKDRREPRARLLLDEVVEPVRPAMRLAMVGVGLLLLGACANAAALILARGRRVSTQLALESALGASRARLVRRQLLEALLMGVAGGVGALALAAGLRTTIISLSVDQIPRISTVAINGRVCAFALVCAVGTAVLAALGPALLMTRTAAVAALPQASHKLAGSRSSRRILGALVAAEVAFAVALAAGATLLLQSFVRLHQVGTGVNATDVGVVSLNIPLTPAWRSDVAVHGLIDGMRDGVRDLPGVTHAAFAGRLPLDPIRGGIEIAADSGPKIPTVYSIASEGYFATVGTRILAGRDLLPTDDMSAPQVALINEVLARQLFGDERLAIGRTVSFEHMRGPVTVSVAGVFEAIRYDGLRGSLKPELYQSFRQAPMYPGTLVYRTTSAPASFAPAIRTVLAQVDPTKTVTLDGWTTLEARRDRAIAQPRFFLVLVGVFAATAVVLAMFGIHGTLSHWTSERRRELSIRVALGADRWAIARLVISRGIALTAIGIAMGLAVTVTGAGLLSQLVYGVSSTDPLTLGVVAMALIIFAAGICAIPARRAMAVDPCDALAEQ